MRMLWNKTAYLLGNDNKAQMPDGSWKPGEPVRTKVYCNRRSAGAQDTSTPDTGLMERAEIEFRASAYSDQPRVELDGKVFEADLDAKNDLPADVEVFILTVLTKYTYLLG